MKLWILLASAFVVQEPISSSGVLLAAYQNHYNVWLIHLLFSVATIFDIIVGYYVGVFILNKFPNLKFVSYLKAKFDNLSAFIGKKGKILGLIFFIPIIFPVSAIFIPWFEISLLEAIVFVFIGEWIVWYGYEWLLVLGVKAFAKDSHLAIYSILIVSLVTSLSMKYISRRMNK